MKKVLKLGILRFNRGDTQMITSIVVVVVVATLLCGSLAIFGQGSRIDDLQQMAQLMAREISLRGEVGTAVETRLEDLERMYKMDVDLSVAGDYIGSSKRLRLESSFVVTLSYETSYGVGGAVNFRKEATYVRKASGIVEEYHKGD